MKLLPPDDDVVLYETGFKDDLLGRKAISKQLSELIERFDNPIVLALDDKWGSGKTYFLKRWVAAHRAENRGCAVTVYFDAFENDYLSDPLVSIISAVSDRIPSDQSILIKKWKSAALKLSKPAFGIALAAAAFGVKRHLDDMGDVLADAVASEANDAAQALWAVERERREAVKSFKDQLVKLTSNPAPPIVIVVDELDRCRPDYALSVLEVIKHFFAVPKVHFIVGINGTALENSVKARYGADTDAEGYLRKFINVSFSLPREIGLQGDADVISRYSTLLINLMELPDIPSKRCVELISYVSAQNPVSLRDVGKIMSRVALLPVGTLNSTLRGWIDILCLLIVSSVIKPSLHKKFLLASASVDEIREFLGATKLRTTETVEGKWNHLYDQELTFWLVASIYACGAISIEATQDLPSWKADIRQDFSPRGLPEDPKNIPAIIQRKWIDVFKIQ